MLARCLTDTRETRDRLKQASILGVIFGAREHGAQRSNRSARKQQQQQHPEPCVQAQGAQGMGAQTHVSGAQGSGFMGAQTHVSGAQGSGFRVSKLKRAANKSK